MKKRDLYQKIAFSLCAATTFLVVAVLLVIIGFIVKNGLPAISLDFITQPPKNGMTEGGILQPLVGTLCLMGLTAVIALPLGIASAIYLTEYAKQGKLAYLIHIAINNLAGVPSIVFGLFGLALFVKYFNMGVSLIAGALTLAIVILPTIIRTSEEAIKTVPASFREASYALGATKWHTIKHAVLPSAIPGILTGSILGLGRAAGETAPVLFTVAAYYLPRIPNSIFDSAMILPYHLYVMATSGIDIEGTRGIQYGSALVLLGLVLLINFVAIYIRFKVSKKRKW